MARVLCRHSSKQHAHDTQATLDGLQQAGMFDPVLRQGKEADELSGALKKVRGFFDIIQLTNLLDGSWVRHW